MATFVRNGANATRTKIVKSLVFAGGLAFLVVLIQTQSLYSAYYALNPPHYINIQIPYPEALKTTQVREDTLTRYIEDNQNVPDYNAEIHVTGQSGRSINEAERDKTLVFRVRIDDLGITKLSKRKFFFIVITNPIHEVRLWFPVPGAWPPLASNEGMGRGWSLSALPLTWELTGEQLFSGLVDHKEMFYRIEIPNDPREIGTWAIRILVFDETYYDRQGKTIENYKGRIVAYTKLTFELINEKPSNIQDVLAAAAIFVFTAIGLYKEYESLESFLGKLRKRVCLARAGMPKASQRESTLGQDKVKMEEAKLSLAKQEQALSRLEHYMSLLEDIDAKETRAEVLFDLRNLLPDLPYGEWSHDTRNLVNKLLDEITHELHNEYARTKCLDILDVITSKADTPTKSRIREMFRGELDRSYESENRAERNYSLGIIQELEDHSLPFMSRILEQAMDTDSDQEFGEALDKIRLYRMRKTDLKKLQRNLFAKRSKLESSDEKRPKLKARVDKVLAILRQLV